jgi:hypothetical protein
VTVVAILYWHPRLKGSISEQAAETTWTEGLSHTNGRRKIGLRAPDGCADWPSSTDASRTPESGKIRLVEPKKIAKEKSENSDAMRTLVKDAVERR